MAQDRYNIGKICSVTELANGNRLVQVGTIFAAEEYQGELADPGVIAETLHYNVLEDAFERFLKKISVRDEKDLIGRFVIIDIETEDVIIPESSFICWESAKSSEVTFDNVVTERFKRV